MWVRVRPPQSLRTGFMTYTTSRQRALTIIRLRRCLPTQSWAAVPLRNCPGRWCCAIRRALRRTWISERLPWVWPCHSTCSCIRGSTRRDTGRFSMSRVCWWQRSTLCIRQSLTGRGLLLRRMRSPRRFLHLWRSTVILPRRSLQRVWTWNPLRKTWCGKR